MFKKKLEALLLLAFTISFIPYISAITLSNTTITSDGLNSTINVSTFSITFDRLEVLDNAITFTNLTYTHPSSCNGASSSQTLFNYTTQNQSLTDVEVFSRVICGGRGGDRRLDETDITDDPTPIEASTSRTITRGFLILLVFISFLILVYVYINRGTIKILKRRKRFPRNRLR